MENRIEEKDFVCTICPNSCRLTVWSDSEGEIHVSGNQCNRGKDYGIKEYKNPERMLITTMRIEEGKLPVIPVRSETALPKEKLLQAVKVVNDHHCKAPVKMGDILIRNILGTGINVVASRNMKTAEKLSRTCEIYDENDIEDVVHHTLLEGFYKGNKLLSEKDKARLKNVERKLLAKLRKFGFQSKK